MSEIGRQPSQRPSFVFWTSIWAASIAFTITASAAEIVVEQRVEQETGVGPHRPDFHLIEDAGKLADCLTAIVAMSD